MIEAFRGLNANILVQEFIKEAGGADIRCFVVGDKVVAAIQDALRHSSLPLFETLDIPHSDMRVQVTIGVAEPDKIDTTALAATLPRGNPTVTAVQGGLNSTNPDSGNTIVIATAAVEAFLPNQSAKWRAA